MKHISVAVVFLLGMVHALTAVGAGEIYIPKPDRAWTVGYSTFTSNDESGLVWYPTRQSSGEKSVRFFNRPVVPKYPVIPDATFDPGEKVPLVILSHGILGFESNYGWLSHALARAGYVVIAPRHKGQSPDDLVEANLFEFWKRPITISKVLDWAIQQSPYRRSIDPTRVYFIGHSVGGHTAFMLAGGIFDFNVFVSDKGVNDAANRLAVRINKNFVDLKPSAEVIRKNDLDYSDSRFKKIVAMDPTPVYPGFTDDSISQITTPFLYVGATRSEIFNSDFVKGEIKRLNPAIKLHETGAGHFAFADVGNFLGRTLRSEVFVDHESVNRRDVHRRLYAQLIEFMK